MKTETKLKRGALAFNLQRFDEGGEGGAAGGDKPKGKEDIVSALKGMEGGQGYLAAFNKIMADSNKSLESMKDLQKQVGDLTTERDCINTKFNKLMDFAGVPADVEDLDAKLEELRQIQKNNNKAGVDAAVLQSKINEIARQRNTMEKERNEHKVLADKRLARIHTIIRDSEITRAIRDIDALEGEALVPLFRDKVKILDDESAVYPLADGSQVTVVEGIKQFFEEHPGLLKNNQNAGGGSGGGAVGNLDYNKMTQQEYEKMRKEGKIR